MTIVATVKETNYKIKSSFKSPTILAQEVREYVSREQLMKIATCVSGVYAIGMITVYTLTKIFSCKLKLDPKISNIVEHFWEQVNNCLAITIERDVFYCFNNCYQSTQKMLKKLKRI